MEVRRFRDIIRDRKIQDCVRDPSLKRVPDQTEKVRDEIVVSSVD